MAAEYLSGGPRLWEGEAEFQDSSHDGFQDSSDDEFQDSSDYESWDSSSFEIQVMMTFEIKVPCDADASKICSFKKIKDENIRYPPIYEENDRLSASLVSTKHTKWPKKGKNWIKSHFYCLTGKKASTEALRKS